MVTRRTSARRSIMHKSLPDSEEDKKVKNKLPIDFLIAKEEEKLLMPRNYWVEFYDEEEQRWICKISLSFFNKNFFLLFNQTKFY